MPSQKLLENQKKTAARLEKQAELARYERGLEKLDEIRKTQLETTKILIKFLAGQTTKTEITNQLTEIGTPDVENVVKAIDKLAKSTQENKLDISPLTTVLNEVIEELKKKPNELPEAPEIPEIDFSATNDKLDAAVQAIKDLAGSLVVKAPDVNVKLPKSQVIVEKLDVTELVQPLVNAVEAIRAYEAPVFEATDLSTVEELLTTANELLGKIEKKKFGGGGGGGGGMVPFKSPTTGLSIQVPTETDLSLPVTVKNPSAIGAPAQYAKLIDDTTTTNVTYIGAAALTGAPLNPASAIWQIKKIDESGSVTSIKFADGDVNFDNVWNNRASLTYN